MQATFLMLGLVSGATLTLDKFIVVRDQEKNVKLGEVHLGEKGETTKDDERAFLKNVARAAGLPAGRLLARLKT